MKNQYCEMCFIDLDPVPQVTGYAGPGPQHMVGVGLNHSLTHYNNYGITDNEAPVRGRL